MSTLGRKDSPASSARVRSSGGATVSRFHRLISPYISSGDPAYNPLEKKGLLNMEKSHKLLHFFISLNGIEKCYKKIDTYV